MKKNHLMAATPFPQNDRRILFGWYMYDWANSAYYSTVAGGLLPVYFAGVIVGPDGVILGGRLYSATTLWGFLTGLAAFVMFLSAPLLGAMADFSAAKKRFLLWFAYAGSLFTLLLYFCGSGDVLQTLLFFLLAQIGFTGANIFYDAFLPQIAGPAQMDRVSGRGYAYGYVGGGIQFALSLALVAGHERLGLSQETAIRFALVLAALWWAGFTLVTVKYLREPGTAAALPERYRSRPRPLAYLAVGVTRNLSTIRHVRQYRHLALFLLAYMLYNDGIQTVIIMSAIYGADELRLSPQTLLLTLLVVQVIATLGTLIFTRLASRIGTKRAVMTTLVFWSAVVTYAYFIHTALEYFVLGGVVGIVLGGSQALSRSFYGSMIPEGASAEFYGFYAVFEKFSAIGGPLLFAVIRQVAGSARLSIVSLMVFFLAGLALLCFVDENKARQAKWAASLPPEAVSSGAAIP